MCNSTRLSLYVVLVWKIVTGLCSRNLIWVSWNTTNNTLVCMFSCIDIGGNYDELEVSSFSKVKTN